MKKSGLMLLMLVMGIAAQATLVDDFSGDLSAYTKSVVLDLDSSRDVSFAISNSAIQVSKSGVASNSAEQVVLLRGDYSLGIGQTLRIDTQVPSSSTYGDFGIVISATVDPVDLVRSDYVAIYVKRSSKQIGYIAFDGTTSAASSSTALTGMGIAYTSLTGLFISQTASGVYSVGVTTAAVDVVLKTITMTNTAIGTAIGCYADVRHVTSIAALDNLRIVPEPATLVLLGLGGLTLLKRRHA